MSKYDKFFARINTEDKLYQWSCKICGVLTIPTIHTTTEIRRHHLKSRHPEAFAEVQPRKPKAPVVHRLPAGRKRKLKKFIIEKSPLKKLKTEDELISGKIDNAIMELISTANLPVSIINHPAFDRLIKLLNPIYILKDKDYFIQEKLPELYGKLSSKIKNITSNLENYSIVIAEWSEEGYSHSILSVTIHFLDNELKLKHLVLAVQPINKYKVAEKLPDRLEEVFVEFGLEWSKVSHFLQAGSSGSTNFEDVNNWDIEKCLGFGLQQSVEDALKNLQNLDTVINKVKKLIRKLLKSKILNQVFNDYQKLEELPEKCFDENVQIPWNILYSMFLSFQENQISLQIFCVENGVKEDCTLEQNEWELLNEFVESLSGFYQAAPLLFRPDTTISSNIPVIKVIMLDLETKKKSNKGNIQLIDGLLKSLQKRFSASLTEQNNIISTLLDPRFKSKYFSPSLNNCYKEWIINDLVGVLDTVIVAKSEVDDDSNVVEDDDMFAAFEKMNESKRNISVGEGKREIVEAELMTYLHEPTISRESSPADYWHINSSRFPYLLQLYCKHATAPATIGEASDKLISLTCSELDKMRKSLNNETLKKMLFLNCNFKMLDFNNFC